MKSENTFSEFLTKLNRESGSISGIRALMKNLFNHIMKEFDLNSIFIYKLKEEALTLLEVNGDAQRLPEKISREFLNIKSEFPLHINPLLGFPVNSYWIGKIHSFSQQDGLIGVKSGYEPPKSLLESIPLIQISYQNLFLNEKIQELLIKDDLTELSNSRYFNILLKKYTKDKKFHPFVIIFFDLDDFKRINDAYGHIVGGKTLRNVGKRLDKLFSNVPGSILCRYGGDEFVIMIPNTPLEEGEAIANMVKENFEEAPVEVEDKSFRLTASFGVSAFPTTTKNPEKLLVLADDAMFKVKNSGKNRVGVAYHQE